jgi:hypothetical protein
MMRRLFLSVVVLAVSAAAAFADVPLVAQLDLAPAHTLPGIPVMFVVTVTNPNSTAKTLYQAAELTATPAQGEAFTVQAGTGSTIFLAKPLSDSTSTVVPPGGSVTLFVPIGADVLRNAAFYDERLSAPGTYDLRMTIGRDGVRTNSARLTVDMPTGDDLAVWKAVTANAARLSSMSWLNANAVTKYPASAYYRFLAFYTAASEKPEDVLKAFQSALAGGVPQPLSDEFTVQVAYDYGMVATTAARNGDFGAADSALRSASATLKPVLEHPANAYTGAEALTMADEIAAVASDIDGRKTKKRTTVWQPLKPFVQCHTTTGLVQFGYTNSNQVPARIVIGSRNRFDPEPADRGQVTDFKEGTHRRAALVPLFSGERSVKWLLDGSTAVFSLDGEQPRTCDESDNDG